MKSVSTKLLKNKYLLLSVILFLALVLRLVLAPTFFHYDILSQAYWGEWIFNNGTKTFYSNNVWVYSWPTQPPLVNLVYAFDFWLYRWSLDFFVFIASYIVPHLAPGHMRWYFDFVKWYTDAQYPESYLKLGFFMSIKFVAIVADLLIGLSIFLIFKKENVKKALLLSLLFLLSPFSFYISALWGQYDQVSFLFLLWSVWLLWRKDVIFSPFLFMLSASMKPTSLIFVPLYLWIYFSLRKNVWEYVLGIGLAIGGLLLSVSVYTNDNLIHFINYDLKNKVFFKSGFRVSTNSFNFWHIFIGDNAREHFVPYLGVPAYIWGWLFYGIINVAGFIAAKGNTRKSILTAFSIVGLGGWLFMINMLERYFFAGMTFSLMLLFYYPKFFKYWLVMSLIFWVNLYHGWWVPRAWEWLHQALLWNDHTISRILAFINVVIFVVFLKFINVLRLKKMYFLKKLLK